MVGRDRQDPSPERIWRRERPRTADAASGAWLRRRAAGSSRGQPAVGTGGRAGHARWPREARLARTRSPCRSADQCLKLTWRDLGPVEVTLDDLDAQRREGRLLLDGLDRIRDDARADLLRFCDERADPVRVRGMVARDRERDLERVEREPAARAGAPGVLLGRQAYAERPHRHQRLRQRRLRGGPARTLELDGLRIDTGLGERVQELERVRTP